MVLRHGDTGHARSRLDWRFARVDRSTAVVTRLQHEPAGLPAVDHLLFGFDSAHPWFASLERRIREYRVRPLRRPPAVIAGPVFEGLDSGLVSCSFPCAVVEIGLPGNRRLGVHAFEMGITAPENFWSTGDRCALRRDPSPLDELKLLLSPKPLLPAGFDDLLLGPNPRGRIEGRIVRTKALAPVEVYRRSLIRPALASPTTGVRLDGDRQLRCVRAAVSRHRRETGTRVIVPA